MYRKIKLIDAKLKIEEEEDSFDDIFND